MLWNHARVAFSVAIAASICASRAAVAQVADCDIAQGKIDILVKLSNMDCLDCPQEDPLVGFGIEMRSFDGEVIDAGTTNAEGFVEWDARRQVGSACAAMGMPRAVAQRLYSAVSES